MRTVGGAERYFADALSFEKEDASALFLEAMAKSPWASSRRPSRCRSTRSPCRGAPPTFSACWGGRWRLQAEPTRPASCSTNFRARSAASPALVAEGWLLGALGKTDTAFDLLDRAEAECQALRCYTGWPGFDPLRADQNFGGLLERLGVKPS
jgi:hypothetical protein